MTSSMGCKNAAAVCLGPLPAAASVPSSTLRLFHAPTLVLRSLQGPFFDEVQLATLAQGLDNREREVMAEAGMETTEYLKFLAEDSANVANDGNFSIQVMMRKVPGVVQQAGMESGLFMVSKALQQG